MGNKKSIIFLFNLIFIIIQSVYCKTDNQIINYNKKIDDVSQQIINNIINEDYIKLMNFFDKNVTVSYYPILGKLFNTKNSYGNYLNKKGLLYSAIFNTKVIRVLLKKEIGENNFHSFKDVLNKENTYESFLTNEPPVISANYDKKDYIIYLKKLSKNRYKIVSFNFSDE